jgi:hypothetical protein
VRASDADRERAVLALREHSVAGRLTLAELTERVEQAYLARDQEELAALASDLPASPVAVGAPQRRRTGFLVSIFSAIERSGRLRLGKRLFCLSVFGSIDLDLRQATFEHHAVSVFVKSVFSSVDVYVPEGVEVDVRGLVIMGTRDSYGHDPVPRPGTPLVRIYVSGVFTAFDVWRVPADAAQLPLRSIPASMRALKA